MQTLRPVTLGPGFAAISISVAIVIGAFGCSVAPTSVAPAAPAVPPPSAAPVESGFLSDYSELRPSEQFADLKMYRDESHKVGYRKLLFRPVEVWRGADRRLEDVPEEDLQFLADSLYQSIHARLSRSFEMVTKPGPDVLEIHLAFTLVTNPESSVDFFSTAVPVKDLSPRQGALDPGTERFVRDCALEAEFSDAGSGAPAKRGQRSTKTVRAAFFDTRRGADTPKGAVHSWEDVHAVFEKWAGVLDERLAALREGHFKPKLTVRKDAPASRRSKGPAQRQ